MATFDIETNKVTTTVNDIIEVEVQSFPKIAEPIDYTWEASVQPESYAIIPTNLMGETGNLSDAVLAAIEAGYEAQLDPGGTLYLVLDALQNSIDAVGTGVNQNITQINTLDANVSALETTVVSRLDSSEAAILSLEGTVAAIDYSQAYIVDSINSAFGGDLTSRIGTIASTYVDANSAIAADLNVLEVAIGNQQASITSLDQIAAGYFSGWDGISAPVLGQFRLVGDVYYQYLGGTLGEFSDGWVQTDKSATDAVASLNTSLTSYVNGLVGDLQSQIDGEITTWFDDYTPANTNEPWLTWLTTDTTNGDTIEQDRHTGDIFYDTSSGYGYRFIKTIDVFSWSLITDNAITQALVAASDAQSTADGKVTVWYQATAPVLTIDDVGDMWVDTSSDNTTKVWDGSAWQDQTNAEATQASTWAANASKLITDPNGNITGWEFGDGSNTESVFKIHADKFQVASSATGHTPFSIDATTGLSKFNGIVEFTNTNMDAYDNSNVALTPPNIIANPLPARGSETSGWIAGYNNLGISTTVQAGWDPYQPAGGTSIVARVIGSPTIGGVFDLIALTDSSDSNGFFQVLPGEVYDVSYYASAIRCTGYVKLFFYDENKAYIIEGTGASSVSTATAGGALESMGRAQGFITIPANARYARFGARAIVSGTDPYLFITHAYCGKVDSSTTIPTVFVNNAAYNVANMINNNTTTINGAKITTGSIGTNQLDANLITVGQSIKSADFVPYTTGFQLKAGAAGTFADPNIYGAYIRGGTLEGATINGANIIGANIIGSHATFDKETGGVSTVTVKTTVANSALIANNTGSGNGLLSASTSGRGTESRGGTYDFYAGGAGINYGPFTGGHDAFMLDSYAPVVGDIVSVKSVLFKSCISQTVCEVSIADIPNDARVFGIYAITMDLTSDLPSMGNDIDLTILHSMNYIGVNSLGEGQINVCNSNGDISNGDYICSSIVSGKGMKQDDDLMHSYTVAKAVEDVMWDNETIGVNGCYEVNGYKVKMIACTYHCG